MALGLALAALMFIAVKFGGDPEWRAGLTWIIDSWLRPADSDARWEQRQS
jgi:hypothetical protein